MKKEERKEISTLDLIYRLAVTLIVTFSFSISVALLIERAESNTSEAKEENKESVDERFEKLSEFTVHEKVSCYIYRDTETGRQYIINSKGGMWELTN